MNESMSVLLGLEDEFAVLQLNPRDSLVATAEAVFALLFASGPAAMISAAAPGSR